MIKASELPDYSAHIVDNFLSDIENLIKCQNTMGNSSCSYKFPEHICEDIVRKVMYELECHGFSVKRSKLPPPIRYAVYISWRSFD